MRAGGHNACLRGVHVSPLITDGLRHRQSHVLIRGQVCHREGYLSRQLKCAVHSSLCQNCAHTCVQQCAGTEDETLGNCSVAMGTSPANLQHWEDLGAILRGCWLIRSLHTSSHNYPHLTQGL